MVEGAHTNSRADLIPNLQSSCRAQQSNSAENPMLRSHIVCREQDVEYFVAVLSHWVFIAGAQVAAKSTMYVRFLSFLFIRHDGSHVQHGKSSEELFGLRLIQGTASTIPPTTIEK